jgi:hypothetical protein
LDIFEKVLNGEKTTWNGERFSSPEVFSKSFKKILGMTKTELMSVIKLENQENLDLFKESIMLSIKKKYMMDINTDNKSIDEKKVNPKGQPKRSTQKVNPKGQIEINALIDNIKYYPYTYM